MNHSRKIVCALVIAAVTFSTQLGLAVDWSTHAGLGATLPTTDVKNEKMRPLGSISVGVTRGAQMWGIDYDSTLLYLARKFKLQNATHEYWVEAPNLAYMGSLMWDASNRISLGGGPTLAWGYSGLLLSHYNENDELITIMKEYSNTKLKKYDVALHLKARYALSGRKSEGLFVESVLQRSILNLASSSGSFYYNDFLVSLGYGF